MGFNDLPREIQNHLQGLMKMVPDLEEDGLERLAQVWTEKETLFREQTAAVGMQLLDQCRPADGNGLLALTSSGSLLSLSPGAEKRTLEYASIKIRTDVPDISIEEISSLPEKIVRGESAVFPEGRLNKTSAVYLLAVCDPAVSLDEQEKRVREATIFLTNGFMKLNRSLHIDPNGVPDQFTMKSMIRYVAKKNATTAAEAKKLIDDFLFLVETGMCLGEKVPLGRIGRFSIKTKEAQKARVVKHPGTGKEITVDAKPAMAIPRISFSSYLKERLAELPVENQTLEQD